MCINSKAMKRAIFFQLTNSARHIHRLKAYVNLWCSLVDPLYVLSFLQITFVFVRYKYPINSPKTFQQFKQAIQPVLSRSFYF